MCVCVPHVYPSVRAHREVTSAVHDYDTKIVMQILHGSEKEREREEREERGERREERGGGEESEREGEGRIREMRWREGGGG